MTPGDGSGSSGVYGPRRLTFLLGTGPFQTLGGLHNERPIQENPRPGSGPSRGTKFTRS
jgi:hypothetical protein